MALVIGQAHTDPVSGLAGRIYTAWTGAPDSGLSSPLTPAQRAMVAAQCEAIATAVVQELQANGTVLIRSTDSGLQRDNTGGNPATLGPTATKTLPGGCIQ